MYLVAGQSIQKGDSGTGISFIHGSYYLTGIVNFKDPIQKKLTAAFKDVKKTY